MLRKITAAEIRKVMGTTWPRPYQRIGEYEEINTLRHIKTQTRKNNEAIKQLTEQNQKMLGLQARLNRKRYGTRSDMI